MNNMNSLVYECENSGNSKLFEFLATNYGISNLADKIYAANNAQLNILNLKKRISFDDIAAT